MAQTTDKTYWWEIFSKEKIQIADKVVFYGFERKFHPKSSRAQRGDPLSKGDSCGKYFPFREGLMRLYSLNIDR